MKAFEEAVGQESAAAEAARRAVDERFVALEEEIKLLEESISTIDLNMSQVAEYRPSSYRMN